MSSFGEDVLRENTPGVYTPRSNLLSEHRECLKMTYAERIGGDERSHLSRGRLVPRSISGHVPSPPKVLFASHSSLGFGELQTEFFRATLVGMDAPKIDR